MGGSYVYAYAYAYAARLPVEQDDLMAFLINPFAVVIWMTARITFWLDNHRGEERRSMISAMSHADEDWMIFKNGNTVGHYPGCSMSSRSLAASSFRIRTFWMLRIRSSRQSLFFPFAFRL
ncbi:hypothetical protein BDN70DRAFT_871609 [Pholiota conissans]|uniref:Uncharacterized protein n=1 Tax=Pholiota conissans TaxID=109636 RepID=A0A9P6D703_9AGAR|nr:hypothetical protein BDN70DRAFT_871609 [Pholiota conissans]